MKKGGAGTGGFVPLSANELWYCGKYKNACKCRTCDGRCGPTNGCPCDSCFAIVLHEGRVKFNREGNAVKKGGAGTGGFVPLSANELWYCGRYKYQCKCGKCDGRCGPTNGCPCDACYGLLEDLDGGIAQNVAWNEDQFNRDLDQAIAESLASSSHETTENNVTSAPNQDVPVQGMAGMSETNVNTSSIGTAEQSAAGGLGSNRTDEAASENRLTCKICLDEEIQSFISPCGHAVACWACAQRLSTCPICRGAIEQVREMYI